MKTNIKINRNYKDLTTSELDKIIEDKNTINLSWIKSSRVLKIERTQRISKRKYSSTYNKVKSLFFLTVVVFIMVWLFNIPKEQIHANNKQIWYGLDIPAFLYDNLKIECDKNAINPDHCLRTWLSIAFAESTFWNYGISNNYFWLMSEDKSIKSWVSRYVRFWYTANSWEFFYWSKDKVAKSRYCLSENSSWSVWYCENWLKNYLYMWYKL